MARQPDTAPAPGILDRIAALRAELRERRAEVRRLDKESAELAGSDAEASITKDQRARAIERYVRTRETALVDLCAARRNEQLGLRDGEIRALLEKKSAEARAAAGELHKAGAEVFAAISHMLKIAGSGGLSGQELLKSTPRSDFTAEISRLLTFRLASLARAASALSRTARDPSFVPAGASDGMTWSELKAALPDFRLDVIEPEREPEPEPSMAELNAGIN